MRKSRDFQPSSMTALEGRVVLSHVVNLTAAMSTSRPPADLAQTLAPADMVPGAPAAPAGGNTFPLDIKDTLAAGSPVYEQIQTNYSNDAGARVVDELIVPNLATGGSTTTEWITLQNNGGNEKVVDVKAVDGSTTTDNVTTTLPSGSVQTEVETAVKTGNTTAHTNVTTLPDGTVQTSRYTDVQDGKRVLIKDGSQPAPDGSIETYSGVKYTVGDRTTTYKSFAQPAGPVKTTETVVTRLGDSGQDETTMTTKAHGHETITNSTTIVWRLNPPS